MIKRNLSLLLVLCLMVSFLPQIATLASAGIYHGPECGEALTWKLDEETGVLTVTGTGAMDNYIGMEEPQYGPWYRQKDRITHVIIEDGVTSIGNYAFAGCTNLTTVEMGSDVETIGNYAFYECSSLTDLDIGPRVEVIGESAFAYCSSLATVVIPGGTISSYAFGWCDMLKEVDSGFIECVYDAAFIGCTSLKSFVFPTSVRYIGNSIFGGSDMEIVRVELDNPYYTIEEDGVLYSKDMTVLYDCFYRLPETFRVPEGVTTIESQAFSYEEELAAIVLPESLQRIGHGAFAGCTGLTEVELPAGVTEIGEGAFRLCSGITEITIPKGVNQFPQNTFDGCSSLKKIHVEQGHPYLFSDEQGIVYYHRKETNRGAVYLCPNGYTGACTIPSTVTFVDTRAFNRCLDLTEVEFLRPSNLTLDGEAFYGCGNLTKVTFHSKQASFVAEPFVACNVQEIYFYGEAPNAEVGTFPVGATLYYIDGAEGWTSPTWNGFPTATFLPFVDVAADVYYLEPVLWAVREGITKGTGEDTFYPERDCTRAQIVTFLWRAAGYPAPEKTGSPFIDVIPDPLHIYYYEPVMWAVEQGITTGTTAETFSPNASCTRSQVVTFLWRAAGCPEPKGTENPFKDVDPEAYYYDAVLWAVAQGITTGTSADKFSPNNTCTRGQIVTFLYRTNN